MNRSLPFLAFLLLGAALILSQSAFIVYETQQAMVLQFGKPVQQYTTPGLKFKVPFIQQTRLFEKRTLDLDPPPEEVILADKKRIVVDTFARYRITDMLAFAKTLQTEQQATSRLDNVISSTLRSTLGNTMLTDVLSEKRAVIMGRIREQVNADVHRFGIEIVDVRIGRADLPEQTSQSIFARMRTEREREAAEFRAQGQEEAQEIRSKAERERTVILAEAEKQAQLLKGAGDETAIRIYADAYSKDPEFYAFYRSMDAYKNSLSGDGTTLILTPDSEFLRYFKNRKSGN